MDQEPDRRGISLPRLSQYLLVRLLVQLLGLLLGLRLLSCHIA